MFPLKLGRVVLFRTETKQKKPVVHVSRGEHERHGGRRREQ